jgi:hypothetical protein
MKTLNIILIVLLWLCVINSCKKDGGNQDQSSNNSNNKDTTKTTTPPTPVPIALVTATPLAIFLPNNCPQSFTITNTGAAGSLLNYTVADDGALGGFLTLGMTSGQLGAGASATITVAIKTAFVNATPSLKGASLVVDVYTPNASNYTKVAVPVNVKGIASITPQFIGTWSGTWAGMSYGANNPGQAQPSSAVSGTWTINLQKIDTVAMTATGSLTWNGTDVYWTYTYDKNGLITAATPNQFIPNRTIQFDATNTTFMYVSSFNGCSSSMIQLTIAGFMNKPNPSDAFYGPNFVGNFDISSGAVSTVGVGFSTHPYAPVTFATFVSSGSVTGKKQ